MQGDAYAGGEGQLVLGGFGGDIVFHVPSSLEFHLPVAYKELHSNF